jgi:hypothetical protein
MFAPRVKLNSSLQAAACLVPLCLALGTTVQAGTIQNDIGALIKICSAGRESLPTRAAKIEAMGYIPIAHKSEMWVQAQIAHIALASLEFDGQIRESYVTFKQSADIGELFLEDIEQYSFKDSENEVHISLSAPLGDDFGCSFAFAKEAPPITLPLPTLASWSSDAGTLTEYKIGGGRFATHSTMSNVWDNWIEEGRLVSAFVVVSQ